MARHPLFLPHDYGYYLLPNLPPILFRRSFPLAVSPVLIPGWDRRSKGREYFVAPTVPAYSSNEPRMKQKGGRTARLRDWQADGRTSPTEEIPRFAIIITSDIARFLSLPSSPLPYLSAYRQVLA